MEESNSKYLITDLKDTVNLIIKMEAGKLDFEPKCPRNVLKYQENCMIQYLNQLEIRAEYEGIVLVK